MSAVSKALLDTDTLSFLIRRHPIVVRHSDAYLKSHGRFTFSEMTRYEVTRGLMRVNASSQLARFAQFCAGSEILPVDWKVLERAAQIWVDLRRQGRTIEEIDILIAASALSRGWAVVSHNIRHFADIAGLTLIDWTTSNI